MFSATCTPAPAARKSSPSEPWVSFRLTEPRPPNSASPASCRGRTETTRVLPDVRSPSPENNRSPGRALNGVSASARNNCPPPGFNTSPTGSSGTAAHAAPPHDQQPRFTHAEPLRVFPPKPAPYTSESERSCRAPEPIPIPPSQSTPCSACSVVSLINNFVLCSLFKLSRRDAKFTVSPQIGVFHLIGAPHVSHHGGPRVQTGSRLELGRASLPSGSHIEPPATDDRPATRPRLHRKRRPESRRRCTYSRAPP